MPGQTPSDSHVFANGVDFFPTILDLAGGQVPDGLDGISLVPALNGKPMPDRKLYWHYPHYGNQGGEPSAIVRDGDWKLIHYFEDGRNELYNLANDPGEQNDVSEAEAARVESLLPDLKAWLEQVDAVMPSANPKFNQEAYEKSLQQAVEVRMPRREQEHWSYLQPDFSPNRGWWQNRGK